MGRKHKGDRARLTLRLPYMLVARIDVAPGLEGLKDRNDKIAALVEVGLVYRAMGATKR